MMLPTHIVIGFVVSLPVFYIYPSYSFYATIGVLAGSIVPDFDLLIGDHRKSLHYPILGIIFSIIAILLLSVYTSPLTVLIFVFIWCLFIHSLSDIFGGSLEDEPWEKTKNKAVYNHLNQKWIDAKRLILYDGSLGDLIIFCVLSLILIIFVNNIKFTIYIITSLFFIGVLYTLFRRTLFSPKYMQENYPYIMNLADIILRNK